MEQTPLFLRNSYWVLRHGKSVPNEKGLIVSSLENGTLEKFGLASEGFNQARLAGELLLKAMLELRERYFGPSFELLSHDKIKVCNTMVTARTGQYVSVRPLTGTWATCYWVVSLIGAVFAPLPLEID
ncbi:hypothetical protein GW17_00017813 [Ensete ventricosum]|nr:hypothetical protein GW17_00017813 [Ensete ventricosum]